MKKIISLILITFSLVYASVPKSCTVKKNPDSNAFTVTDVNKTIKACTEAIKKYPNNIQYFDDLGSAYDISNNSKEAFRWYLRAAKQGHASAQYSIGNMYSNGKGIKEDKKRQ